VLQTDRFLDRNARSDSLLLLTHVTEDLTVTVTLPAPTPAVSAGEGDFPFRARVDWASFDELAKQVGSAGLRALEPGTLAHLQVKRDVFVVAREEDFQRLVGIAAEAGRLSQLVHSLVEGLDLAATRPDPQLLAWMRDTAHQLIRTLEPARSSMELFGADEEGSEEATEGTEAPRGYELDSRRIRAALYPRG
jgi:hypothetical protein